MSTNIKNLFQRNPLLFLFWPFLVGTFITGGIQLKQQSTLRNETAPHGIVSLELGKTFTIDTAIIGSWNRPSADSLVIDSCAHPATGKRDPTSRILNVARSNVYGDYGFILFYTGLAILIIGLLRRKQGKLFTGVLIALALIMGVMDGIENHYMLQFIDRGLSGSLNGLTGGLTLPRPFALTKMWIIAILLIYIAYELVVRLDELRQLTKFLHLRWRQFYQYRVIFFGLIFFVAAVWFLPQGQDLMINTNATWQGVVLFMTILVSVALVNWYLAKLFFQLSVDDGVYPLTVPVLPGGRTDHEKKVSRLLGVSTILGPSMALLNALKVARIPYFLDVFPPGLTLAFWLAVFYILIRYDVVRPLLSRWPADRQYWPWMSILLLLAVVLPLGIFFAVKDRSSEPHSLYWVHIDLLLLALAFFVFVSGRDRILSAKHWLKDRIPYTVLVVAIGLSAIFLFVNICPQAFNDGTLFGSPFFATLPLLLCGIGFYSFAFTLLIRLGRKLKINFVLFIFIGGVIIAVTRSNDYHLVELKKFPEQPAVREELAEYFKAWLDSRRAEIMKNNNYPVFIVNTYGGGIKASAFTSMVLTYLDSASIAENGKAFEHYVFSISGASGGTTGAAVHCAYREKKMDDPTAYRMNYMDSFYRYDFLTSVLLTNVGRDVLTSSTSFSPWPDRAGVQAETWADLARDHLSLSTLDSAYTWLWKGGATRYEVPLLFANTLNVDDGLKGICAPVRLRPEDFPATIFIQQLIDDKNKGRKTDDSVGISLITGAFLSARFPFISPGGKMGPKYHFIDGGGKDNSGASTSECIFLRIKQYIDSNAGGPDSALFRHLHFHFISINHSIHKKEDPRVLVDNHLELASPLVGIVNSGIDGNARAADSTLNVRYGNKTWSNGLIHTDYFPVYPVADAIPRRGGCYYSPVLPLGWQISAPALQLLRTSFDSTYRERNIRSVINLLPGRR